MRPVRQRSAKLMGGAPELQLTTRSAKIDDNAIDLTPWLKSLTDVKTHIVVDIADEGLVGLDNFVLETNFKRRIRDSHMGYLYDKEYQTPYIEILKVYERSSSSGELLCYIAPVLTTRHGDKIVFADGSASAASDEELRKNNDPNVFMQRAQEIANQKGKFYQCEIKTNTSKIIRPYLRIPLTIELKKFNETKVFKYKNPATNIWYIYDMNSRIALSYYDDEYISWVYGMNEWFDSISVKSISMSALYQLFTIIGL